jgi:hypothetical protein
MSFKTYTREDCIEAIKQNALKKLMDEILVFSNDIVNNLNDIWKLLHKLCDICTKVCVGEEKEVIKLYNEIREND